MEEGRRERGWQRSRFDRDVRRWRVCVCVHFFRGAWNDVSRVV